MKTHQPIVNPHARIGQIVKKTKTEEKEELIAATKTQVLEKYGATRQKQKKTTHTGALNMNNTDDDKGFQLDEKVDKMTVGIRLLSEGFMQAYIDFFYLTNGTTPSMIMPSEKLLEEQKLNKQCKTEPDQTPEFLTRISDNLQKGELHWRNQEARDCFKTYEMMAQMYERFNNYETASYFHNRCLDISIEFKYIEGEAQAHRGLGICEEKVFNKYEAMHHLETALQKAKDGEKFEVEKVVSKDLVRVYQLIAFEHLETRQNDLSLQYFEKCLIVAKSADDRIIEAECYQQIGMIYAQQGELDKAVEFYEKFLEMCKEEDNIPKQIEAHQALAGTFSQANDTQQAINHLNQILKLASQTDPAMDEAQAEASLKLGLLYYKPGEKHNIRQSSEYLGTHFTFIRHGEQKNSRQIDLARVNLGIVKANMQIKQYQYMVKNPEKLKELVEWKVFRDQRNLQ